MCDSSFQIHHLPKLLSVWFLATFVIAYVLAVSAGHVYYFFPYISDSAAIPPERSIFAQMMNMGSVLLGTLMYLRYLQIKKYLELGYLNFHQRWNDISIKFGIASCLGICVSGSFPETDSLTIHLIGAGTTVVSALFYFIIDTKISYDSIELKKKLPRHGVSKRLFYLRLFLTCGIAISHWVLTISGILAVREFMDKQGTEFLWWTEKDGGFQLRLVSTFSEWLLFILMFIYMATSTNEFKVLEFKKVVLEFKDNKNEIRERNGIVEKLD